MHSGVNEAIDREWNITTGLFGLRSTGFYMKKVKDVFPKVRYEYSLDISTNVYLRF